MRIRNNCQYLNNPLPRTAIEAKSAVLHFVFFIVIVNKMQQSAKERCLLKRNTLPEVFPLTIGSGKTKPFEKRHAGCEEREKINRRRIFDTLRINFFEATKQTACIFSKGEMDEETGLYYYGARYLDPKYSRWLSGDPALNDYIPKAPIDDEAKKYNENLPGMGGVFNVVNLHLYHYAGNNPVKYTDPDGKSPLSLLIPNPEKISKEDARKWIDDNVCTNNFGFLICQDMYTKSFRGDTSDYVKGKDTYIATAMRNDTDAYANKIIKTRLKAGITEGSGGTTSWTKNDLKLSLGSCGFSWKLDSYDEKNKIATVTVTVTDIFDFNKDDKGNRDADAEKLTALGRKAELSSYKVKITYELQVKVSIPLTEEK